MPVRTGIAFEFAEEFSKHDWHRELVKTTSTNPTNSNQFVDNGKPFPKNPGKGHLPCGPLKSYRESVFPFRPNFAPKTGRSDG